jgi:uncharacterized membrane protein
MDENLTRSQKFGIQWRWLFLVGGVVYVINITKALIDTEEAHTFLGFELTLIPYLLLNIIIAAWLLNTFVKNHKLFRRETLKQLMDQQEDADHEDPET